MEKKKKKNRTRRPLPKIHHCCARATHHGGAQTAEYCTRTYAFSVWWALAPALVKKTHNFAHWHGEISGRHGHQRRKTTAAGTNAGGWRPVSKPAGCAPFAASHPVPSRGSGRRAAIDTANMQARQGILPTLITIPRAYSLTPRNRRPRTSLAA